MTGEIEDFRQRLGERLAIVSERFPNKAAAARAAGVTTEQFRKWLAGTVKVPVEGLWRLALSGKADFRWLCAGSESTGSLPERDDPSQPLDAEVMQEVLVAMIAATQDDNVIYASPEKFAELACALHDYVLKQREQAESVDLASMGRIMRLGSR